MSFPSNDKLYTIQCQTRWNLGVTEVEGEAYVRTNRALDRMEEVRDYNFPHTSGGAFISFKDSSNPTETYFQQNYKRAKTEYSFDPYNCCRSRKQIM